MHRTFSKLAIVGAAFVVLIGLTVLITGKPATGGSTGLVDDWTHHHLIFSNPGTFTQALAQGRFKQWYRTINDPRYIMQQMKRNHVSTGSTANTQDFATLSARLAMPLTAHRLPVRKAARSTPRLGLLPGNRGSCTEHVSRQVHLQRQCHPQLYE
jgi:hypothetical protein